jgi:hypothetical protein
MYIVQRIVYIDWCKWQNEPITKINKLCPLWSNMCTYVGNFHLIQLDGASYSVMAFMTRGHYMFQLMASNGLVELVISEEKKVEKLFHFLFSFCRSVLATPLQCRPFTGFLR